MNAKSIISSIEALQILRNQLRAAALEKRSAELSRATDEERKRIEAQIKQDVEDELRRRVPQYQLDAWVH